jgi:hypothetical protein
MSCDLKSGLEQEFPDLLARLFTSWMNFIYWGFAETLLVSRGNSRFLSWKSCWFLSKFPVALI